MTSLSEPAQVGKVMEETSDGKDFRGAPNLSHETKALASSSPGHTPHHQPLREALLAAPPTTSPFSMRGKCKLGKIVDVLREDTLTAIMPCDGVLTMFLIKLKGVGCWPDLTTTRASKLHAMRHLATLATSKLASLKCYFHTLNNELVCSVRMEDGTDLAGYLLDNGLTPPFTQTADVAYRPLAIHPPHPPPGPSAHHQPLVVPTI